MPYSSVFRSDLPDHRRSAPYHGFPLELPPAFLHRDDAAAPS
jgi:hypothetical protein